MNRKRAIAPCIVTLVLFTLLCIRVFSADIHFLVTNIDSLEDDFIFSRIIKLTAHLALFVGVIFKSLGTFSKKLLNKLPDAIGSSSLLIAFSILTLLELYYLVSGGHTIASLLSNIVCLHAFASFVLLVIGTCMCKKENSKLRSFVVKIWYLPGIFFFLSEIAWITGYFVDVIRIIVEIHVYFVLGLWLAIPYFGAKKKVLQPTMPVASANYVQPKPVSHVQPQPVYTQPVAPVSPAYVPPVQPARPAYTPPVQPAHPAYTPPVQPAQQQAKVTADANSQAQALEIYKDLLDKGTITQEDYDKKKKEILGI